MDKLAAGTLVEVPFHCAERRYIALRHGDRHRGRAGIGSSRHDEAGAWSLAGDRAPGAHQEHCETDKICQVTKIAHASERGSKGNDRGATSHCSRVYQCASSREIERIER